jgi:hypothetical protein
LYTEVTISSAEDERLLDIDSGFTAAQNDLRFSFSAKPLWLPPDEVRFHYTLERQGHGLVGTTRTVTAAPSMPVLARSEVLIDLPPGHYRLVVEAFTEEVRGPPTTLEFTIRSAPPRLAAGGVTVASAGTPIAPGTTLPQWLFGAERSVELHFNAFDDTTAPGQIGYEYRILTPEWQPSEGDTARVSLPPGTYQAEVRAVDADGNRSDVVLMNIIVPAPLWTTIALASLVILVPSALSGLGGALLYRRWMRDQALRRAINGYRIPYDVGPLITTPDRYIGRAHVLDTVLGKIGNHSFYIYGEKRIGKTSLLMQIGQRLQQRARLHPRQPIVVVFRNMQQVPADQFWFYLMRSIVATIKATEGTEETETPSHAQPSVISVPSVAHTYDDIDAENDLEQIIRTLQQGDPTIEPLIVLMIDEIDTLQSYDPGLRQRFRAFCQHTQRHLRVILAGVLPPNAEPGDTSPWYNIFERIALGPLSETDTLHLIRKYNDNPYRYSSAAEQAILLAGERKPFATQWLCSEAVRSMLAARRTTVSADDVDRAVAVLVAARDGEYRALWGRLHGHSQTELREHMMPGTPEDRELLFAEGVLIRDTKGIHISYLFRTWLSYVVENRQ